jgi:hypothetical protein
MLTIPEMQSLLNVIESVDKSNWHQTTHDRYDTIRQKLQEAMVNIRAVETAAKMAKPEGTLIENVTPEEADVYNQRGEQLMLAAASSSVPEHTHAKLASIMVGLTSAICRLAGLPRLIFCNDLMSNVLFTALKAAYNEGLCSSGTGGKDADGHT